jgi:hypothetical protein
MILSMKEKFQSPQNSKDKLPYPLAKFVLGVIVVVSVAVIASWILGRTS